MHASNAFLADLALVTSVAAVFGLIARKFKQPNLLGYLFAGLLVGPYVPIPITVDFSSVEALSEFGLVFVLFAVGLDFRIGRLFQLLPTAGFTTLVQVALMLWVGSSVGDVLGWSATGSLTLGAALAMSSTMVVSGVFRQEEVAGDVHDQVMGVLIVQDVVSIVLMTIVTATAAGMEVAPSALVALIGKLVGLVLGMLVCGVILARWLVPKVAKIAGDEGLAVLAVGFAFGFASIAAYAEY